MVFIADSGSTKTDWKLLSTDGNVSTESTRGFNPYFWDSEAITAALFEDFEEGLEREKIQEIYFYGAGCSDVYRCDIIKKGLLGFFPNADIKVGHDLIACARAACGTEAGVVCILGTGSNSCLYDGSKITDNVASLGSWIGDEGSGLHLGKELLRSYFYREMPKDIIAAFKLFCPDGKREILNKTYSHPTPNVYLASFSKFLSERQSHPYVQQIVLKCFDEFLTRHVLKYKGVSKLPIHFVGSIAFHFEDSLKVALTKYDLKLGNVLQKPIDSLVEFHRKE
ncbi:MAG: hypothetical protein AAF573_14780 [Bacteroidota bacterium]